MSISPTIKIISFLKRRPGLSLEEFERHYENNHVPLVLSLLPKISRYTRSYINPDLAGVNRTGGDTTPPCDVVTEVWFETDRDYQAFQAACADLEVIKKLQDDEVNFLDLESVKTYPVKMQGGDL